jgi:MFS family permease
MGNQWQRFLISYANGVGSKENDPKYEILTSYPELKDQGTYGLLAGLAFTLSFATFGIFGGYLSDKLNRKMLMIVAGIAWSLCTFLSGLIDNFAILFVLRFFLGIFESGFNPCAYSMIADMFHPNKRTTASAIFNLGIYFGGALASLSSIMIKTIGWR